MRVPDLGLIDAHTSIGQPATDLRGSPEVTGHTRSTERESALPPADGILERLTKNLPRSLDSTTFTCYNVNCYKQ